MRVDVIVIGLNFWECRIVLNTRKWQQLIILLTRWCGATLKSIVFYGKNGKRRRDTPLYDLRKFTVWCVRLSRKDKKNNYRDIINKSSGPCSICQERLKRLGFGKIAFSNELGEIETYKLSEYNKLHLSGNHRRLIKKNTNMSSITDITNSLPGVTII